MRQFQTSVLERKEPITEGYATEPFECAWAQEAIFFVTLEEAPPAGASIAVYVQISADGTEWIDEGGRIVELMDPGAAFVKVRHFGGSSSHFDRFALIRAAWHG